MNERAGIAAEGGSACRRCGKLHLFDVLFFPLLLGKPNQANLSAADFLVPEEIMVN